MFLKHNKTATLEIETSRQREVHNVDFTVPSDLANFFDLLARFDFEDKQKERSAFKTGSLVSAPKGPVLSVDPN